MGKDDAGKLDISSLSLNIQIMNQQVCLHLPFVPYLFSSGKVTQNLVAQSNNDCLLSPLVSVVRDSGLF